MEFGGELRSDRWRLTRVSVSPLVGYQVSRMFSVGAQLSYDDVRQEVEARDFTVRSYGGRTFGRMHVNQFYAHLEPVAYDQEVVTPREGRKRHRALPVRGRRRVLSHRFGPEGVRAGHLRPTAAPGPGVTLRQAQADLRAIARRLERQHPEADRGPARGAAPIDPIASLRHE